MPGTDFLPLKRRLDGFDWALTAAVMVLVAVGLALINSADHAQGGAEHFQRQAVFSLVGIGVMVIAASVPPRAYYALAYIIYAVCLFAVAMVFIGGVIEFGARRWLNLGGVLVQPSEPMKLAFVVASARILIQRRDTAPGWRGFLMVAALALPPMMLVLLQPDLGTATVFPAVGFTMLIWMGIPLRILLVFILPALSLFFAVQPVVVISSVAAGLVYLKASAHNWLTIVMLSILCGAATITAPMAWSRLEPYQQKRLTAFLDPTADPLGSGYQVIQSKVAIGSGGLTGMGFRQGTQTQLRFLPEQHTDFIFSLAGEEFGFVGNMGLLLLFSLVILRGIAIAQRAKTQFMGLVAIGILAIILYHAVVNIGMAVGLMPVTGLPLPFLSYGGSFLLTCMTGVGVALSMGIRRRE